MHVNAYLPNHYQSLRVLIFANNSILQVELLKKSPWLDSVAWGQRSKSDLKKDGKMGGTQFGAQPFSLLILVTCISTLVSDVFLSKNLQYAVQAPLTLWIYLPELYHILKMWPLLKGVATPRCWGRYRVGKQNYGGCYFQFLKWS